MTHIAITGVSGSLGSRLAAALSVDPAVDTLSGIDAAALGATAPKLDFMRHELREDDLGTSLAGVDVLVHLALAAGPAVLRDLLDLAAKEGVRHVVVGSSTAVYGAWPTNQTPLTENAPLRPNPGFSHAVELAESERVVSEWRSAHPDTLVSVLRLGLVTGGDRMQGAVAELASTDWHRHYATSRPMQFLHVDDAITAFLAVIGQRLHGVFNVAPPDFVPQDTALAIAGAPPRPLLPRALAEFGNRLLWFRRRGRRTHKDFEAIRPYLDYPCVVASDRLQEEGWSPRHTSGEALIAVATPTRWNSLKPGEQRNVVNTSIVGLPLVAAVGVGAIAWLGFRRWRR